MLLFVLIALLAFARSKNRSPASRALAQPETALAANDLDTTQPAANSIYSQATNTLAMESSHPSVICGPAMRADLAPAAASPVSAAFPISPPVAIATATFTTPATTIMMMATVTRSNCPLGSAEFSGLL